MKVTQKAKRSGFLAIIFACVASLVCGFALLKTEPPVVTAESVPTTAVYDYHDLTGQYFRDDTPDNPIHTGTAASYLGSIQNDDMNDFVVEWKIQTLNPDRVLNIGILVNGAYDTWGAGYWVTFQKTNGATMAYENCGGANDNIFSVAENNRLDTANAAECAYLYEDAFDFQFGSKVTEAGRYVYVKINGEILLEGTDAAQRELGNYVNADTYYRCSIASLKEQTDLSEVKSYDIHDLKGQYKLSLTDDWGIGQTTENENVEFTTVIKTANHNYSAMPIAILGGADNDYGYAYRAIIDDKANTIRLVYGCTASGATEYWENETRMDARTLAYASVDGINSPSGYEFTLGAKRLTDCTYIYVKVNGETVLVGYDIHRSMGKWVSAGKYGRAEFFSTKLVREEAVVYDYHDLTGEYEHGLFPDGKPMVLGTMSEPSATFKTIVDLREEFNASEFGFTLFTAGLDTYGSGISVHITANRELNFAMNASIAQIYYDGVSTVKTEPLAGLNRKFTFEFGVQRLTVGNEAYGQYVFIKINGETVVEYLDGNAETGRTGTNVVANTHSRCNLISTKISSEAEALVEGVEFEMKFGASVRISEPTGLRFVAVLSEADYDKLVNNDEGYTVSFGMLITPADIMETKGELSLENKKYTQGVDLMNIPCENLLFVEDEENGNFYEIRGVISEVKEQNYARNFVGRAYITLTKAGISTNVYADYNGGDVANNTRSVYEVSAKVLIAGEDSDVLETFVAVVEANFDFVMQGDVLTVSIKDSSEFTKVYLPTVYYDKANGEVLKVGE